MEMGAGYQEMMLYLGWEIGEGYHMMLYLGWEKGVKRQGTRRSCTWTGEAEWTSFRLCCSIQ